MHAKYFAIDVGAVVCCAGRGYLTHIIPIDADDIYSRTSSLLHLRGRAEALRTAIPMPVKLINAHDKYGITLATSVWLMHSKYLCMFAPLLGC